MLREPWHYRKIVVINSGQVINLDDLVKESDPTSIREVTVLGGRHAHILKTAMEILGKRFTVGVVHLLIEEKLRPNRVQQCSFLLQRGNKAIVLLV